MRPRDLIPFVLVGAGAAFVGAQILSTPSLPRPATRPSASPESPAPVSTTVTSQAPAVVSQGAAITESQVIGASAPAPVRDANAVRVMLRDGAPGTYIMTMLDERERRLVRWPERQAEPLRVWISRSSNVPNWNAEYPLAVERSFDEWRAAGFPIAFHFVHDSATAQIRIVWSEKFTPRSEEDRPIGRTHTVRDRHGWLVEALIILATHTIDGRTLTPERITGVARHEVGHALGLAHSTSRGDVMYPQSYSTRISASDRATLHLLYKLPPGLMP